MKLNLPIFSPALRREKLSSSLFFLPPLSSGLFCCFFFFCHRYTRQVWRTRCQQQRRRRATKLDPSWGVVPAGWPAPLPDPRRVLREQPKTRWPPRVGYFFHTLFLKSRKWIRYIHVCVSVFGYFFFFCPLFPLTLYNVPFHADRGHIRVNACTSTRVFCLQKYTFALEISDHRPLSCSVNNRDENGFSRRFFTLFFVFTSNKQCVSFDET